MLCSRNRDEVLAAEKMDVLYGEADTSARERVEAHLRECAACRDEMTALRRLRRSLGAWTIETPPARAVAAPRHPAFWLPAAAAVILALGLGLALHGVAALRREVRAQEARAAERERRHRQELALVRAAVDGRPAVSPDDLLARVEARLDSRIRASEQRQDRRLSAGFAEWSARMEAQRRVDLARVAAGLSYLDGRHGQQLARTNELMGYVLETADEDKEPR